MKPEWVSAVIAFVERLAAVIVAFVAGQRSESAKRVRADADSLVRVQEADAAYGRMSDDERMRYLRDNGLLRDVSDAPANGERK